MYSQYDLDRQAIFDDWFLPLHFPEFGLVFAVILSLNLSILGLYKNTLLLFPILLLKIGPDSIKVRAKRSSLCRYIFGK